MKKYYVYEWIRLDYNEPFYVGKGKENRCYSIERRNKHFKDIITFCNNNEVDIAVSILEDNLEEECAYQYECWYINLYVTEYGYNITSEVTKNIGINNELFDIRLVNIPSNKKEKIKVIIIINLPSFLTLTQVLYR